MSALSFKTIAVTFCYQGFFFFFPLLLLPPLRFCTDLGNKSLALVRAQGHTMQCDQYYQIVTKTNLESLWLQQPEKVFWIFYEAYLIHRAGLCDNVTIANRCRVSECVLSEVLCISRNNSTSFEMSKDLDGLDMKKYVAFPLEYIHFKPKPKRTYHAIFGKWYGKQHCYSELSLTNKSTSKLSYSYDSATF